MGRACAARGLGAGDFPQGFREGSWWECWRSLLVSPLPVGDPCGGYPCPPRCVLGQEELLPIPRAAGCRPAANPKSLPPFLTGLDPAPPHGCSEGGSHRKALVASAGNLGPRDAGSRSGTDAVVRGARLRDAVRAPPPPRGAPGGWGVGGFLEAMPTLGGGLWAGSPSLGAGTRSPGAESPAWAGSAPTEATRNHLGSWPRLSRSRARRFPRIRFHRSAETRALCRAPSPAARQPPPLSPPPEHLAAGPCTQHHPPSVAQGRGASLDPAITNALGNPPPGPLIGVR